MLCASTASAGGFFFLLVVKLSCWHFRVIVGGGIKSFEHLFGNYLEGFGDVGGAQS